MTVHIKSLLVVTTMLGLGACTTANQPAGAFIDEGGFGNATMRNTQAMTQCVGRPKGYIVPDHVVVLNPDPKSPPRENAATYRRAHIRCSGDLNGKYAQVIFGEYVESATELPPSEQGGLSDIAGTAGG